MRCQNPMAFEGLCKPWMLNILYLTTPDRQALPWFPDPQHVLEQVDVNVVLHALLHAWLIPAHWPGLSLSLFSPPPPLSLGVAFAPGGTEWSNKKRLWIQGTGLPGTDLLSGKRHVVSPHLLLQTVLHYVWQRSLVIFWYDTFLRRTWGFFHFFTSSVLKRMLSVVLRPANFKKRRIEARKRSPLSK